MNVYLKGNYNNHFIKLLVNKNAVSTNKVFISLHGIYGISGDEGSKSELLGKKILEQGLAHVVQYSSSRNWSVYSEDTFEQKIEAFKEKTFQEEQKDFHDTLDLLLEHSSELFAVEKNGVRFFLIGNSLGGTMITTLGKKFEYVDKVCLCGSGSGSGNSSKPILSTYEGLDYFDHSASEFTGDVLLLQGENDETVPLWSGERLLQCYSNATNKKRIVLKGLNHNFSNINGENQDLAYQLYVDTIIEFLKS